MDYVNFSIRISPKAGSESIYALEAESWDGASCDGELDGSRLRDIPDLATAKTGPSREAFEDEEEVGADPEVLTADDMRRIGDELYAALFESSLGEFLQKCRATLDESEDGPGVRFRLDFNFKGAETESLADLARLPWELLRSAEEGESYLNKSIKTPVVRSLRTGRPDDSRDMGRTPEPLRVLFMESNPHGTAQLDLSKEIAEIKKLGRPEDIEIERVEEPTLEALKKMVEHWKPHVFHFMGHGVEGDLLFERPSSGTADGDSTPGQADRVDAERFYDHLHPQGTRSDLKLVFLNACETGKTEDFSDVASYLVRNGVPAVVAMQKIVLDSAAIAFSASLYAELVKGASLDHATTAGRLAIDERLKDKAPLEWATPMLFLRRNFDGVLVDRKGGETARGSDPEARRILHPDHPGLDTVSVWFEEAANGEVFICWHNPDGTSPGDQIVVFDREPSADDLWTGRKQDTSADETPREFNTRLTVQDVRKCCAVYLVDDEIKAASDPVVPPTE